MNRRHFLRNGLWVTTGAVGFPSIVRSAVLPSARRIATPTSVSIGCSSSDTTVPHDTFLEGFQTATTGYENTWSEFGTTANITPAGDSSALTSGKPTGACNQAIKFVMPSDGTETYIRWNRGSLLDIDSVGLDLVFYIYVEDLIATDLQQYNMVVLSSGDTIGTYATYLALGRSGANTYLNANGADASANIIFTRNAWHQVNLHLHSIAGGSYINVDGGSNQPFTRVVGVDFQYLWFGSVSGLAASENNTIWFDLICLNTP